jgi:HK97 family phage portal protein
MGLIANAFKPKNLVVSASGSSLGSYSIGAPQASAYQTTAAYLDNEIIRACVDLICTSAGEPQIIGKRWRREKPRRTGLTNRAGMMLEDGYLIRAGFYEELTTHPLIDLLNNPNPWMGREGFWATVVLHMFLAGNAYLYKARTKLGNMVVELWPLLPNQVKPVPGDTSAGEPFIKHYERTVNGQKQEIPTDDVIHIKYAPSPNLYEGVSPLLTLLPRAAIDHYMRTFLSTFFQRGGAGAGASLNVKGGTMDQQSKDDLRSRFQRMFSGGQFDVLVSNAEDITYTPFSLNRGLRDALPKEIDAQTEARMAMVLGVPGSIVGLLIGYETSSYANQRQAWQVLWDVRMTPLLRGIDGELTRSLVKDFEGIDEVCFDLSDIKALQEDIDSLHERLRKDLQASAITLEEFRERTGYGNMPTEGMLLVPSTFVVTPVERLGEEPEPAALPAPAAVALIEAPRIGRPRLEEDEGARDLYARALKLKRENPLMTWDQVSANVGIGSSTLRKYRDRFDDE